MSYAVTPIDALAGQSTVVDLWERNLHAGSADRYAWLYGRGPATGWLLRSAAGEPIGSTGMMLRRIRSEQGPLRAGQAIDLNVDREHRSVGPALALQRAVVANAREGTLDLIYGFPNQESKAVFRRLGYRTIGSFARWVKPLSWEKPLRPWIRGLVPRKAVAFAVDCVLRLKSSELRHRLRAGMRVCVTDRFDQRFDKLWQAASGRFRLVGERTSHYLNWRFSDCPHAPHRVFCLLAEDNRLLAYLVYSRTDCGAYLSDFFFAEIAHFEILLARFLRQMRQDGAESVATNYAGSSAIARSLKRFGFWQSPSEWNAVVFFDAERFPRDAGRWLDPESWFLTRADADTDD